MLAKFEVCGFKGFSEKLIFDFTESKNFEFNVECVENGVVRKALIYGHNGVGKSNLGFAIFDLISHATDKYNGIRHYSNYLNAYGNSKLAEFSYKFKFGTNIVFYEYGKSDPETVVHEKIIIDDVEFAAIDRRESSKARFSAEGTETLNRDFGESQISLVSYLKNNAVLKKNSTNDCFSAFIEFINGMLFFRSLDENSYIGLEQGSRGIGQDIIEKGHLQDFEEFLNKVGIKCKLAQLQVDDKVDLCFSFNSKLIRFFEVASQGTKALALFYYWLQRMKESSSVSFLFIDEFDAFYHHELSAEVVRELKKISAQVVVTTHNTSLLSNEILRPDCCFLMDSKRISPLSSLTNKELREAHNIEKMYRAHAFNV